MKKNSIYKLFIILAFLLLITSCDTTENNSSSVSLNFATNSTLPKVNNSNLQLDDVKILIRDIKIKNQSEEDTLQIKTGPYVVNLNLNGNISEFAVSDIPAGSYDRIRFEIHQLEASENPPDADFKDGNNESLRYSVIVKGTLDGNAFTYKCRRSAHQDIKLAEPITVGENENVNLTINVNPYDWFYSGDSLLNPSEISNENKINKNICNSFKNAYKDQNRDGLED